VLLLGASGFIVMLLLVGALPTLPTREVLDCSADESPLPELPAVDVGPAFVEESVDPPDVD